MIFRLFMISLSLWSSKRMPGYTKWNDLPTPDLWSCWILIRDAVITLKHIIPEDVNSCSRCSVSFCPLDTQFTAGLLIHSVSMNPWVIRIIADVPRSLRLLHRHASTSSSQKSNFPWTRPIIYLSFCSLFVLILFVRKWTLKSFGPFISSSLGLFRYGIRLQGASIWQ